jgi:hypothetical protein
MKSRLLLGGLLVVGLFSVGTVASRGTEVASQHQWTLVNFANPVRVQGLFLMGPYLIVHDDAKMARGEACTSIYRFDRQTGPKEKVLEFHCRPAQREVCATSKFTIKSDPNGGVPHLAEYQFAGDSEGHGVPQK